MELWHLTPDAGRTPVRVSAGESVTLGSGRKRKTEPGNCWETLGTTPPEALSFHIVPRTLLWTFTRQIDRMQPGDRLTVRTNCTGTLQWQVDEGERHSQGMTPAGGVMAGVTRHYATLGPFSSGACELRFRFICAHRDCDGQDICCDPRWYTVIIVQEGKRFLISSPALGLSRHFPT